MNDNNNPTANNNERRPLRLLFVCLGNICRSPAAEAVMRKKLSEMPGQGRDIIVDSAGLGPWHAGQLPDSRMRRAGAARGYDINSIARQIREADFGRYTYIIGMDDENMRALRRLKDDAIRHGVVTEDDCAKLLCAADFMTHHPDYKTVPDPYYGNERDFRLALELIEDACDGIIEKALKR